jgi:hypothetical protein
MSKKQETGIHLFDNLIGGATCLAVSTRRSYLALDCAVHYMWAQFPDAFRFTGQAMKPCSRLMQNSYPFFGKKRLGVLVGVSIDAGGK